MRTFATVSPCFVATATYGSQLAAEVRVLRRLRDRHLLPTGPGRSFVAAYYKAGPLAASLLERHPALRALARSWLAPLLALARRIV